MYGGFERMELEIRNLFYFLSLIFKVGAGVESYFFSFFIVFGVCTSKMLL